MSNWLGLKIRGRCQSGFALCRKHTGTQAEYPAPYPDRNPHQKMFKSGRFFLFGLFCFVLFYKSTIFGGYMQYMYLQDTHSPAKVLTLLPSHKRDQRASSVGLCLS